MSDRARIQRSLWMFLSSKAKCKPPKQQAGLETNYICSRYSMDIVDHMRLLLDALPTSQPPREGSP